MKNWNKKGWNYYDFIFFYNEYIVINKPKPIANNKIKALKGLDFSIRSSFRPPKLSPNCNIRKLYSFSPPVNILMLSTNATTESINVVAFDTGLNCLGKNSSTKPTIKGKKTEI